MIKSENGSVEVKGKVSHIMADLTLAIKGVRSLFSEKVGEEQAQNMVRECIRIAFMEEEEMQREISGRIPRVEIDADSELGKELMNIIEELKGGKDAEG